MAKDAPGMKGNRSRNQSGELRQTRGDKLVRTLEKQYGVNLNVRGDMKISTYLEKTGQSSVHEAVHNAK